MEQQQQRKKGLAYFIKGDELKDIEEDVIPTYTIPPNRDAAFVEPQWAELPKMSSGNSLYLEVWKGSAVIARYNIGKQKACVIGRHPQFAHIHSYHDSISRQHMALVHGNGSKWYCIDLKSFHGTFIDGKRIEPWKPILFPEGAKLTLGGSSRAYSIKTGKQGLEKEEQVVEPPLKKLKTSQNSSSSTISSSKKENERSRNSKAKEKEKDNDHNDKDNENEDSKSPVDDVDASSVEKVHCSHLLVKHNRSRKPVSWSGQKITRTKEEALKLLLDYRSIIASGEKTFSSVAKKYSDCSSAKKGGDLGFFKRGDMQPSFDKASFALQVGELSLPIESDSGVHIIFRHA